MVNVGKLETKHSAQKDAGISRGGIESLKRGMEMEPEMENGFE